jgi:hypothetical protein
VAALAGSTEADPVAVLVELLVGVGSILGRGPHYRVGASCHGTNEFVVLVGPSGSGRKGSSWDVVAAVLAEVDQPWVNERVVSGLSSGEGLIWHLRDTEHGPVADPRLLVLETELASTLKAASRETNTLSPVLRNAWDHKTLQVITKHDPARASAAHVSIIGYITADELCRHISATEAANGFMNRFLVIAVRRARLLPEGGRPDPARLAPLVARLTDTLARHDRAGRLGLDDEARAMWWDLYPTLSAGRPGLLGAICGRAEAHVVRLALLYALIDHQGATAPPTFAPPSPCGTTRPDPPRTSSATPSGTPSPMNQPGHLRVPGRSHPLTDPGPLRRQPTPGPDRTGSRPAGNIPRGSRWKLVRSMPASVPEVPDDLVRRVCEAVRDGGIGDDLTGEELTAHAALAVELADGCAGRPEVFDQLVAETDWTFDEWALNLPRRLSEAGMIDEALKVADALGSADEGHSIDYVCDAAGIAAEAGRAGEARDRLQRSLERFGDIPHAWMAAGETLSEPPFTTTITRPRQPSGPTCPNQAPIEGVSS